MMALKYVIFLLAINMIGCTLSLNISDLNKTSKMNSEAPSFQGVIEDGITFGSLSSTPIFTWPAFSDPSTFDHYELAIGSAWGHEDILTWTRTSDQNFSSQSGLSLVKGSTYFPMVRVVDRNGNASLPIYGDGWVASTLLSFLQPVVTIVTGETANLALTGGELPYVFNDSGSGYINSSSGTYTAPLNIDPLTETVTGHDSAGQIISAQVKVRAFELKDSYKLDNNFPIKTSEASSIAMYNSTTIFSAGSGNDVKNLTHWLVRKSTDGGSSWTLADDYQLITDTGAAARKVKIFSGVIYVIGSAFDGANNHWIIRKSSDGGSTWITIDDFQFSSGKNSSGFDLDFDSMGNIYCVGYGYDLSNFGHWLVRKSTDGGLTWIVVDDFYLAANFSSSPYSIHIDSNSNIFVSGEGWDSSNISHWLVRRSSNNGLSWTTVDDYARVIGKESTSLGIMSDNLGNVYSVGFSMDSADKSFWTVRKSSDFGSSWSTVDSFQYIATRNALAEGIALNNSGHIFVTGYGLESSWNHSITRKSTDGGSTWITADDYLYSTSGHNYSNAITLNNLGDIYTAGWGNGNPSASAANGWTVRKSTDNGTTWITSDFYTYCAGSQSLARSTAYDSATQTLYSLGAASDGTTANINHWIVRKSLDAGATWVTVDDFQLTALGATSPNKIIFNNGVLFTIGMAYNSSGYPRWVVRKSTDAGVTWNTIDNWSLSGGAGNISVANIVIDQANNLYVTGTASDGSGISHAIVRKSTNNGSTWNVVNDYQLAVGKSSYASGSYVDASGALYVVGQGVNASNSRFWLVRKSTDQGVTWNTLDSFQWFSGYEANATSIYINSSNEIYVTGLAKDNTSNIFWTTRKSSDGGNSWNIIDSFQFVSGQTSTALTITGDMAGNLFAGGYGLNTISFYTGLIRKSSNAGATWTTIETVSSILSGNYISISSLIPCLTNQICAAGSSYTNIKGKSEFIIKILSPE